MKTSELTYGEAQDVAGYLMSADDVPPGAILSALVNAMSRIAKLERALSAAPPVASRPALAPDPSDAPVPAPWFVVAHPGGAWTIQDRQGGGGRCVAQSYGDSGLATARLLCAAPELAEALDYLMVAFVMDAPPTMDDKSAAAYRKAKAALQKAGIIPE